MGKKGSELEVERRLGGGVWACGLARTSGRCCLSLPTRAQQSQIILETADPGPKL